MNAEQAARRTRELLILLLSLLVLIAIIALITGMLGEGGDRAASATLFAQPLLTAARVDEDEAYRAADAPRGSCARCR